MVAINQVISENPKKSQIPISEVSITVENSSSATDTTSKTTEGTNSTTTEDCSIEDLQKEIEMLKKKIIDERLKLCDKTVVQVAEAIGNTLVFLMLKKVHELNKLSKWCKCVYEHVEYSKLSILKSFNQG